MWVIISMDFIPTRFIQGIMEHALFLWVNYLARVVGLRLIPLLFVIHIRAFRPSGAVTWRWSVHSSEDLRRVKKQIGTRDRYMSDLVARDTKLCVH